MKKIRRNGFLVLMIMMSLLVFSGCSPEKIEDYVLTSEEVADRNDVPTYNVTLADKYLKLEKTNNAEHLIPVGLLHMVFPGLFDDHQLLSVLEESSYLKKEALTNAGNLNLNIDGQIIELSSVEAPEPSDLTTADVHSGEIIGHVFLVNQEYPIDAEYISSLTPLSSRFVNNYHNGMQFDKEALEMLEEMGKDFYSQTGRVFINISTYRSYEHQERLFTNRVQRYRSQLGLSFEDAYKKASEVNAIPGTSEHQTGLAIDFTTQELLRQNRPLTEIFSDTIDGQWLTDNAHEYGFILRYPKDKTEITKIIYEPWHFRYVGKPHSQIIKEYDLTLEEYMEKLDTETYLEYDSQRVHYVDPEAWFIDLVQYPKDQLKVESDNRGGLIVTKY